MAAREQADIRAARFGEIERGEGRYGGLVGDEHYDLRAALRNDIREARPDRPAGLRNVPRAVAHGRAQVDNLRGAIAQGVMRSAAGAIAAGACGPTRPCAELRPPASRRRPRPGARRPRWPSWRSSAGDDRRAHLVCVQENEPRALDATHWPSLHQLAARCMREAGHGAGSKLLGRTPVEQIGRARGVGEPRLGLRSRDETTPCDWANARARALRAAMSAPPGCRIAPARAVLEGEACQRPALRTVLQRVDRVGDAEVDEDLRPDDGACAAGAVDDDLGLRVGGDVADAQHQFAVGAADPARDVHFAVFREGAAVDDDEVLARALHGLQLLRGDAGRVLSCSTSSPKALLGTLTPS